MSIGGILRGHDLFAALGVEDVDRISSFSRVEPFDADQTIFEHRAPGSHVYLLLEGHVYLRIGADPGELGIIASKVEKGEIFGLSPMLGAERYTASAHCRTTSSALAIEARPFRDLLRSDCSAGFQVMNHVAHVYFERYMNVLTNLQAIVNQLPLIHHI